MTPAELLRKADAALASARRDFDAGDLDGTANRLYYAMFHAARAALLSIGEPVRRRYALSSLNSTATSARMVLYQPSSGE